MFCSRILTLACILYYHVADQRQLQTPPFNDMCMDALDLSGFGQHIGRTSGATFDNVTRCGFSNDGPGVWYTTVGNGGPLVAETCHPSTNFDTKVSVFEGTCGNLTCIGGDDNEGDSLFENGGNCDLASSFMWDSVEGQVYYILVHGRGQATGDFEIDVDPVVITNPPNDMCNYAMDLGINQHFGTTVNATFDNAGQCGFANNTGPGVWYTTVGDGNPYIVETCHNTTDFDTKISVFGGSCGNLTCIGGNDNGGDCGTASLYTWETVPGETYYILVHGRGLATGNFGIDVDPIFPPSDSPSDMPSDMPLGVPSAAPVATKARTSTTVSGASSPSTMPIAIGIVSVVLGALVL